MGNSDLSNSEDILIKVDQNNLIYIDPNSIVNTEGEVEPRGIKQENLVIYVNLEADIIPRSILIAGDKQNTLVSVAKGTLNFLRNSNGGDFDTSWTNSYNGTDINKNIDSNDPSFIGPTIPTDNFVENTLTDSTAQSFGIESISITTKGFNAIPQVTINFIDIRGKTLFESPQDSPYKAFFHLPWPIFYLTVKGYYGKSIRYRLHLVKLNTKFNETNGNFQVETSFVGSTYAYLNDIPINGVLNAPYMYMIESSKKGGNFNTKTNTYDVEVSKSSRGYQTLISVYNEMKQKGLIDKDFPVKTLRELIVVAESLDRILENEIFSELVDFELFASINEYEKTIINFERAIRSWAQIYMSIESFTKTIDGNEIRFYYPQGQESDKQSLKFITGRTNTAQEIVNTYIKALDKINGFTNSAINSENKKSLKNKTSANFSTINANQYIKPEKFNEYVGYTDGKKVGFAIDKLVSDIRKVIAKFNEEKQKFENDVENKMNTVLRDPEKGIGFEPTIRNIFGVVLANAEVYIRLLKDVHYKAFEQGNERKSVIGKLQDETPNLGAIFPWPEVKKNTGSSKQKIVAYPGDEDLIKTLKSDDYKLWPEVEFLENYEAIGSKRMDTLVEKEGGVGKINYIFSNNLESSKIRKISAFDEINVGVPYVSKVLASVLYEIFERSYYTTLFDSFDDNTLKELVDLEFKNIQESFKEDNDIIDILKSSINSVNDLYNKMKGVSPFERLPYLEDQLPTTSYLVDIVNVPFKFEQYIDSANRTVGINQPPRTKCDDEYVLLLDNLINYKPDEYRKFIYPFNSNLYLDYLNVSQFEDKEFLFNGALKVDTLNGLITSQLKDSWFKKDFDVDIFKYKLKIESTVINNVITRTSTTNTTSTNILNTPYFHNQLYSDFSSSVNFGKYAGSSYLLLNSLPFYDLEDNVTDLFSSDVRLSTVLREVSSTHFIPYHLLIKWGSIYHRYKKYILENVDILNPIFSSNTTSTIPFNTSVFFNNNTTETFTVSSTTINTVVNILQRSDVGLHPYYDAVFHQVVNGYNHYEVLSGDTSFSQNVQLGGIICRDRELNGVTHWTNIVDNSKYKNDDLRYTFLPCDGNKTIDSFTDFDRLDQISVRVIWDNDSIYHSYTGLTFPSYDQYFRTYEQNSTTDNLFSIGNDYRKVIDLIGTFSPKILDEMEDMFLTFSSRILNEEIPFQKYNKVKYYHFQQLLKDLVSVEKKSSDSSLTPSVLLDELTIRQQDKLKLITQNLKSFDNLISYTNANPKEIDPHVLNGFSKNSLTNTFKTFTYTTSQATPSNLNLIKLHLGEDIDNHYINFFSNNDVELNEENILQFRHIIYVYAGQRKLNPSITSDQFKEYLRTKVNFIDGATNLSERQSKFLESLVSKFGTLRNENNIKKLSPTVGFGTTPLKLDLWNYFKSFNDKWVAGNSMGQRLLMEEFLFLDKSNKDIGNDAYFNIKRLIPLDNTQNQKQNLYGVINILLGDTGFTLRALPSYVNFYGANFSNRSKPTPSKNIAKNIFGTFLEVDYQESTPKILIQYVGPTSKHLNLNEFSKQYLFTDDSFNAASPNRNPLIITTPINFNNNDLFKSNRVVAFEVSFGDQNQSIFKGIQLDQSSIKNTTETMIALENLARSETGSNAYQVDIGLYEIYRQASYKCTVTCLGNVMIQPTMYFYLKNIPMFKGTYWIVDVAHTIRNNSISTSFTGVRIPYSSLPDPKESFMATYRPLFESITNKALSKYNEIYNKTTTDQSITLSDTKKNLIDFGEGKTPNGEVMVNTEGVNEFGVSFNGANNEKYIQYIDNQNFINRGGTRWLRARVVRMDGPKYKITDSTTMSILSRSKNNPPNFANNEVTWKNIKDLDSSPLIWSTRFDQKYGSDVILNSKTTFLNPFNNQFFILDTVVDYNLNPKKIEGPINSGPSMDLGKYGLAMNNTLMSKMGLTDGDVVYFYMEKK